MQTCRFGIRPYLNGGSPSRWEVFDRMTGAAVASGMRRPGSHASAVTRTLGRWDRWCSWSGRCSS
jgi:hypothetical protein